MRAAVYEKYGPPEVLRIKDVDIPSIKEDEVLVKVHASTVTPLDYRFRNGKTKLARLIMTGLFRPKVKVQVLGVEMAGEVVKVGNKVQHLKDGDHVLGTGSTLEVKLKPGEHTITVVVDDGTDQVEESLTIIVKKEEESPGFGLVAALAAVLIAGLAVHRRLLHPN